MHENDAEASWLDLIAPRLHIAWGRLERAGWVDPRRVIYDHELMLFGEGGRFAFEFILPSGETRTVECPGSSFIIIPPGQWHTCRGLQCDGVPRAWLHFDWIAAARPTNTPILTYWPTRPLADRFRQAPAFVPPDVLTGPIPDPAHAFELHRRAAERFNGNDPRARATARALLLELLLHLLSPDPAASPRPRGNLASALAVRDALDRLSAKPFIRAEAIKPYLAGLGQSYDHLARLFRANYGVTPLAYVNTRRIERAKHLLTETDRPIGEIARQLGFREGVYFNRLFRKITGHTPGRFRSRATPT